MQANTPITGATQIDVSGLASSTNYTIYFAAQDNVVPPNVSTEVEEFDFMTTSP